MPSSIIRDVVCFGPRGRLEGDCLIEDGRIVELGRVTGSAEETIRGEGRWLWPGAIDGHVHFREPGPTHKEDWTSGSMSAVAGGVTSVLEMPNTNPATTSALALEQKRAIAAAKSLCNYGLFFGASPTNSAEYTRIDNVPGLKIFMGCSTGDLLVHREEDLQRVFAAFDQRIGVHAESERLLNERGALYADRNDVAVHSIIRNPETAAEAVRLACKLAIEHERHLHILHLSTQLELDVVKAARQQAQEEGRRTRISCEVCPHHLFLSTSAYDLMGTKVRMNPPLRDERDREAMWQGLIDGHIDMIATDHAPHTIEEKARPYREAPSGVPGVQTMLVLMLDAAFRGLCTYEQVLQWVCQGPANVWGIVDRGTLEVGAFADLVLIDPHMRRKLTDTEQLSRCAWTPWAGRTLTGWPVLTLVGGRLAYRRDDDGPGEIVGSPGIGRELSFHSVESSRAQ
ncbi:MAG: dihydroorotase [Bradymonadaceae bacterium]|nr:dihydroorotase [Lujinxingiaceae bacterium]